MSIWPDDSRPGKPIVEALRRRPPQRPRFPLWPTTLSRPSRHYAARESCGARSRQARSRALTWSNYLDAARQLASQTATIVRGVVRRIPLLAGFIVALVVAGVVLLFQGSSSQLVGGVTSILAALGLTWKGLGGALGQLAGKLEQPLWGAVLDDAIADAITLLPDNKAETAGRRAVALALATGPTANQPR